MKAHNPELISALVDGELHGLRRWFVERHLKQCPICAADYRRIRRVREMLAANPVTSSMSDSPEFFWSKVKRGILASEARTEEISAPQVSLTGLFGQRQFFLMSATMAVAAVVVVILAFSLKSRQSPVTNVVAKAPLATVAHVETALPNTSATAFEAKDADATVIWVSGLPWTKDMNEMQTLYASLDS